LQVKQNVLANVLLNVQPRPYTGSVLKQHVTICVMFAVIYTYVYSPIKAT